MRGVWFGLCLGILVSMPGASAFGGDSTIFKATTDGMVLNVGEQAGVNVFFDTAFELSGWSIGFCHDETTLGLIDAVDGAATLALNGGSGPDFNALELMPLGGDFGLTQGVVVSFGGADALPVANDLEILLCTYEWVGDVPAMTTASEICFCDTLGDPVVINTVVDTGGAGSVPVTMCGSVTFIVLEDCQFLDLTCTGGVMDASLTWSQNPGQTFDYINVHRDGVLIDSIAGDATSYDDLSLAPGAYHYALIGVCFPDPQGSPVIDVAECDVDIIPVTIDPGGISPTAAHYLGSTALTIMGTGFEAAMDTTVTINGLTAESIVIVDDTMITCVAPPSDVLGLVDITVSNSLGSDTAEDSLLYGFIRGHINDIPGEPPLIDIADSVYALDFLFLAGPPPICDDAVDVDDDGAVSLVDPIYLLDFLFTMGPMPLPPFEEPGLDPTPGDPFDCLPVLP